MPAAPDAHASSFIDFIEESPTSYHAVASMVARLEAGGFTSVDETVAWHGIPGSGFVRRDGALIAWRQPAAWTTGTALRIVASHTDSPALKLKPHGALTKSGFRLAETEVYGGPIVPSWFDRDLALAGRLIDTSGVAHLVRTRPSRG